MFTQTRYGTSVLNQTQYGTTMFTQTRYGTSMINQTQYGTTMFTQTRYSTSRLNQTQYGTSIMAVPIMAPVCPHGINTVPVCSHIINYGTSMLTHNQLWHQYVNT